MRTFIFNTHSTISPKPCRLSFIGICMIGDFRTRLPNDAAMTSLKQLIECGVANKKIASDYTVQGHCDVVANTECPGQSLLNLISTWEHYQSGNQSHCVTK